MDNASAIARARHLKRIVGPRLRCACRGEHHQDPVAFCQLKWYRSLQVEMFSCPWMRAPAVPLPLFNEKLNQTTKAGDEGGACCRAYHRCTFLLVRVWADHCEIHLELLRRRIDTKQTSHQRNAIAITTRCNAASYLLMTINVECTHIVILRFS